MQMAEAIFFRSSELVARPAELTRGREFTTKVCWLSCILFMFDSHVQMARVDAQLHTNNGTAQRVMPPGSLAVPGHELAGVSILGAS